MRGLWAELWSSQHSEVKEIGEEPPQETRRCGKWRRRTDWKPNEEHILRKHEEKPKELFKWVTYIYQDMPKYVEGNRRRYLTLVPLEIAMILPYQEYVIQQPLKLDRELKHMHAMIHVTGGHRNLAIFTESYTLPLERTWKETEFNPPDRKFPPWVQQLFS